DGGRKGQWRAEGAIPLTPIQHWFFQRMFGNVHHWNQAFWFKLKEPVPSSVLIDAIGRVAARHHAFRLRFNRSPEGAWTQEYVDAPDVRIESLYLDRASQQGKPEEIAREASRIQRSLNIHDGPLACFALVESAENTPEYMLAVVHH